MTTHDTSAGPAPTTHEELAATLYDAPVETSGELYPIESAIKTDLDANETKLQDRLGLSPDDQAAERRQFLDTMRETKLDEDARTVLLLHKAWTEARLADAPGTDDPAEPAELAEMNKETRKELRLRYGTKVHGLRERTQAFVRQHPLLSQILGTGTVGSQLDVIEALIQHVQRHGLGR